MNAGRKFLAGCGKSKVRITYPEEDVKAIHE